MLNLFQSIYIMLAQHCIYVCNSLSYIHRIRETIETNT